ncbi:MAG TPA: PAS domain S-box protein [Terriglobales bacterium]|nr:PAS domain S-box protein [Terriglobales bacterium]
MATAVEQVVSTKRSRVLLADSDKVNLVHMTQLLEKSGYDVVTASEGPAVLRLLQSEQAPQLAVLGWSLPGMEGIEVCRRFRQSGAQPHTWIALLTKWGDKHDRGEALEAGADDILYKPVDIRELRLRMQIGTQTLVERALRESEQRFHSAFEHAGVGMALIKISGEFLQTNEALSNFLGRSRAELMATTLQDVSAPDDTPSCAHLLNQFREGSVRSGEFERRFLTKDGTQAWASLAVSSLMDADNRPNCFVLQLQNITERKRAEEALRRSEAFSRAITDNAMDLIMVVNTEHRWIYASPSHFSMLGYEPREVLERDMHEIVHPADQLAMERSTVDLLNGHGGQVLALRFRHKNGNWRHLEASSALLRNYSGDVEGIVVIARAVDDRILAEQKLQAAYAETELFLQAIPSILIGIDTQVKIKRWNLTAANTFDFKSDRVLGKSILDCGIQWRTPEMDAEVARWLQTEVTCSSDSLSFELDGKGRYLGLHVRRIPPQNGQEIGFILTGADITERKLLEEQLRQAQKLEAIGQLAAGIAHEINTPTQYVGDNIRFLQDAWRAMADVVAYCQEIRRQAGDGGAIPPPMLEQFDALADKADLGYHMTEIPHAIEQSLDGLQRVATIVRAIKEFSHPGWEEKKGIDLNKALESTVTVAKNEWKYVAEVSLQLDHKLPPVSCLAGEINQVLLNLVINASHAIADVVRGTDRRGQITISTRRDGEWAEVSVGDTGGGIPKEISSRVFEPFFTTKAVGQGTGQGLALAHSVIVTRHQGKIWFESVPGTGTTFFIQLPLGQGGNHA